jgi:hypothetical protein
MQFFMRSCHLDFLASLFIALAVGSVGNAATLTNSTTASAHSAAAPKSLKDSLLPAVKNGGFAMDDYIIWCASVIKVGDTYHLFASRWPAQYGLAGWTSHSECVRAVSTNLYGSYTFQEVVLQKRTNNWDNTRIHNVKIVKAGSKFVLYYINSANQTGYAVADSVTGPWTRLDKPVMRVSNPAPLVRSDGGIYVFGRLRDSNQVNRGIAFTAPSYQGPYTLVDNGNNLLPDGRTRRPNPLVGQQPIQHSPERLERTRHRHRQGGRAIFIQGRHPLSPRLARTRLHQNRPLRRRHVRSLQPPRKTVCVCERKRRSACPVHCLFAAERSIARRRATGKPLLSRRQSGINEVRLPQC